jgi:predicted dehydrogenase
VGPEKTKLSWGILGTGRIAEAFAAALKRSRRGALLAVASRSHAKAQLFSKKFSISKAYSSYQALLADPEIQAVYISLPHPLHAPWSIQAARAGKHILCEKPMAMNAREAAEVIRIVRQEKVFFMEALMYRCHPQTLKLLDLIRSKVIGDLKLIKASFGFKTHFDPENRLFKKSLGGGAILDLGCYPVSMTRMLAGLALGKDFAEPQSIAASGQLGKTRVDETAVAIFRFPGNILAQLECSISINLGMSLKIWGTKGEIEVPEPWVPPRQGGSSTILLTDSAGIKKKISVACEDWLYAIEADCVAEHLQDLEAPFPAATVKDSLANMRALDRWRQRIGLTYAADRFRP